MPKGHYLVISRLLVIEQRICPREGVDRDAPRVRRGVQGQVEVLLVTRSLGQVLSKKYYMKQPEEHFHIKFLQESVYPSSDMRQQIYIHCLTSPTACYIQRNIKINASLTKKYCSFLCVKMHNLKLSSPSYQRQRWPRRQPGVPVLDLYCPGGERGGSLVLYTTVWGKTYTFA